MSSAEVIVKYDGPGIVGHKMDIEAVAPAMLALAELVKRANYLANGDRASVKVLAHADVEQHCFQFDIEIVQDVLERARTFLADEDVKTAKEIAEWIGIGVGSTVVTATGLYKLLKILKGRKPDSMEMVVRDGKDYVQITAGDDEIITHRTVAEFLKDSECLRHIKATAGPLEREGYDSLEFIVDGETAETISKGDAKYIQDFPDPEPVTDTVLPSSSIRAWVRIRKAVYDGTGKWTIQYDRSRDVAMHDLEWLEKFQSNQSEAPPGSMLEVTMSVSEIPLDKDGKPIREPEYAIEKVHDVKKPAEQQQLFPD